MGLPYKALCVLAEQHGAKESARDSPWAKRRASPLERCVEGGSLCDSSSSRTRPLAEGEEAEGVALEREASDMSTPADGRVFQARLDQLVRSVADDKGVRPFRGETRQRLAERLSGAYPEILTGVYERGYEHGAADAREPSRGRVVAAWNVPKQQRQSTLSRATQFLGRSGGSPGFAGVVRELNAAIAEGGYFRACARLADGDPSEARYDPVTGWDYVAVLGLAREPHERRDGSNPKVAKRFENLVFFATLYGVARMHRLEDGRALLRVMAGESAIYSPRPQEGPPPPGAHGFDLLPYLVSPAPFPLHPLTDATLKRWAKALLDPDDYGALGRLRWCYWISCTPEAHTCRRFGGPFYVDRAQRAFTTASITCCEAHQKKLQRALGHSPGLGACRQWPAPLPIVFP